jgi:hypothetical protein
LTIYCIDLGENSQPHYSYAYVYHDRRFPDSGGFQTRQSNMPPKQFASHFGKNISITMIDENGKVLHNIS